MRRPLVVASCAVLATLAPSAFAEELGGTVAAQVLFDRGRSAFDAGRIEEACAAFEESMRLDPANGTLLNLARCHEQQGRVTTAWSEYRDALDMSRRLGQLQRAAVAEAAMARLEPRLPKLKVVMTAPPPGVVITHNGTSHRAAFLGAAMPVDPGAHVISVSAPGREAYETTVHVDEADTHEVVVPALDVETVGDRPSPLFYAGVVSGSVALTSLVAGAALGGVALAQQADAESDPQLCPQKRCTPLGRAQVDSAETKADAAVALLSIGGALAAASAVMLVVDRTRTPEEAPAEATATLVPWAGPQSGGFAFASAW